jgi:xanthine dehydrogenase accessory factor
VDFAGDLPRPAVMCTLVRARGSVPQSVGVRLWAAADRFIGTLGGGALEHRALALARRMLDSGEREPRLLEIDLTEEGGQACGGKAEVFFEPVCRRKAVHMFGAGHVGRALASVLSGMPLDLHIVDHRPEWGTREGLPSDVSAHCSDLLDYCRSRDWTADDAICVFTHGHELDFPVARFFLDKPVGYIGVIGSMHKAREFRGLAASESEALGRLFDERVRCPVGLPLKSKNPKVIAVSMAAELLSCWALR